MGLTACRADRGFRVRADRGERSARVRASHDARLPPEELCSDTHPRGGGRPGVEERLAIRHRWHDERAARAERAAERLDEPEGPAGDGTNGPERRVNEKDGSLAHAERTKLVFDLRGGAFAGHGGMVGRHHA